MKEKIDVRHYTKLFLYGNKLMLAASKSKYFVLLLLSFSSGMVSPLNAIVWKMFLDRLVCLDTRIKITLVDWSYLVLLALIPFGGYIFNIVLQYVKQTYSDQMNLFITDKVLNKTLKLPIYYLLKWAIRKIIGLPIKPICENFSEGVLWQGCLFA